MNQFELSKINSTIVSQRSRSETLLCNSMSRQKFNTRMSQGDFTDTLNYDLSDLRQTRKDIVETGKLIKSGKYDQG